MTTSEKVKYMIEQYNLSLDNVSKYLGITSQSLRNKLNRDSFSIKDLIIISHMCHAALSIQFENTETPPITFKLCELPKEDYERLQQLDYKKIQNTYEDLKKAILEVLPPEDSKRAIDTLQSILGDHM